MATKLTYAVLGPLHRATYPDHINKAMDTYLQRSENIPLQLSPYFRKEAATTLEHKITTWSNVLNHPRRSEDTEALPYEVPAPGYDKTITLYTYRLGTMITRTYDKIDLSGAARRQMTGLLDSGRRFIEAGMANVINTGASTAGSDGSYVFGNDHYHEDAKGGTWSNLDTSGALTTTTFDVMRYGMRNRTNEKGQVSPVKMIELVTVGEKEMKARQITGSDKVAESSTNAINPWKGVDVKIIDYLSSTTAFYGWGDLPEDMWGLHYAVLTEPNVMSLALPSAAHPDIIAGYRIYLQVAFAASQAKNMTLNVGA